VVAIRLEWVVAIERRPTVRVIDRLFSPSPPLLAAPSAPPHCFEAIRLVLDLMLIAEIFREAVLHLEDKGRRVENPCPAPYDPNSI
jgi:hypothetical protein